MTTATAAVKMIEINGKAYFYDDVLKIGSWEDNGYDDSDFYVAYWIRSQKVVVREMVGSTRYAGGGVDRSDVSTAWTFEDVEAFRMAYQNYILCSLIVAESNDIDRPKTVEIGDRVEFLTAKNARKAYRLKVCEACNGSGKWVKNDRYDCRVCKGSGKMRDKESYRTAKLPVGTVGLVQWVGTFNQCYSNGYNQIGRNTLSTSVLVNFENEDLLVSMELSDLKLAKTKLSVADLNERAFHLSYYWQIASFLGCKAWMSTQTIPTGLVIKPNLNGW